MDYGPKAESTTEHVLVDFAHTHRIKEEEEEVVSEEEKFPCYQF